MAFRQSRGQRARPRQQRRLLYPHSASRMPDDNSHQSMNPVEAQVKAYMADLTELAVAHRRPVASALSGHDSEERATRALPQTCPFSA